MADTTPISNALNIRLGQKLGDPPTAGVDNGATAAVNGVDFTATQRNLALNQAYNELAVRLLATHGELAAVMCEGLVATQAVTFAAAGVTINKDYIRYLRLVGSTSLQFVLKSKAFLDNDQDPYIDRAYALEGGKLYAYIRSAGTLTLQSSGTGTFYYIKSDRKSTSTGADVAVNTAPDTTIDQNWLEWCMEYGAWWLAVNKGSDRWLTLANLFSAQVESKLPKA
jgi:hypothetical protein